jgi:hypothetical protein
MERDTLSPRACDGPISDGDTFSLVSRTIHGTGFALPVPMQREAGSHTGEVHALAQQLDGQTSAEVKQRLLGITCTLIAY